MMMNLLGAIGLAALSSFGGLQPKQSYVWNDNNDSFVDIHVTLDDFDLTNDVNYQLYRVDLNSFNITKQVGVTDTRISFVNDSLYIYKWKIGQVYNFAFAISGQNLYPQYQVNNNRLPYSVSIGENSEVTLYSNFCYYNYSNGYIDLYELNYALSEWAYYDPSDTYYLAYSPYNTHDYHHGFRLNQYDFELYPFVSLYDYGYSCTYTNNMIVEFVFRLGMNVGESSVLTIAYDDGYSDGYYEGEAQGYSDGYQEGTLYGYDNGYAEGLYEGRSETHYSFTQLFGAIADTPVLIVRNLFDFDLFGVNVLTIVMSLFTAMILFYLFRKLL